MNVKVLFYFIGVLCGIMMPFKDAKAVVGRLSPQDFNKMYYLASKGKVDILRNAVNRGLNIDSVNPNGDTGLCIAVKRNNQVAYNSFRLSGANTRHPCTFRMYNRYQEFLNSSKKFRESMVVGNENSLYYREEERNWWPWILGGLAIGGGVSAMSGGGGSAPILPDNTILPSPALDGLATITGSYTKLFDGINGENRQALNASNPNASSVVNKIKFLPNMLDNAPYLSSFIKVTDNGKYTNRYGGSIVLGDRLHGTSGDGAIGISVDSGAQAFNSGYIKLEAFNGAIGMVASGEGSKIQNEDSGDSSNNGKIDIIFRGDRDGDAVIGMYADTQAVAINNGVITGTTTQTPVATPKVELGDLLPDGEGGESSEGSSEGEESSGEREEGEEEEEKDVGANSGTMIGMSLFDFYTGTDFSDKEVVAINNGLIDLKAGYNGATDASVSLIGMGSYIDDKFLQGNSNPYYAEKMVLDNYGEIDLSYQGAYNLDESALKLGEGGLIGMRADANARASNIGNINIDLTATTIEKGLDVATGMLSVHGAELLNIGEIEINNEATSGGVAYGMLATEGSGAQSNVFKWQQPSITNMGIINMNVSNGYGMASFAGGTIENKGTINLGIELGQSYYTNNFGMYAGGSDKNKQVTMINDGTININSRDSVAMQNDFAGSAVMINNGTINVSHKASTQNPETFISNIFKGNFSKAENYGTINYKVGNTLGGELPSGDSDVFGTNVKNTPFASVVSVSSENYNQEFVNKEGGKIIIGDKWTQNSSIDDNDYGGTYNTAGIKVSHGGTVFNHGEIILNKFENDVREFNTGIWLSGDSATEARVENYGGIYVSSTNSIGIRNDSTSRAIGRNLGKIVVDGDYSYGMSVTQTDAQVINGKNDEENLNSNSNIIVSGKGSAGMYVSEGKGINYGTISLKGDHVTAVLLNGKNASFENRGNGKFEVNETFMDVVYYWLSGGASKTFEGDSGYIEGYTLAKISGTGGGIVTFKDNHIANVKGQNSHLAYVDGSASGIYNKGVVNVSDATAVIVRNEAMFTNDGSDAEIYVKDAQSVGIDVADKSSEVINSEGASIEVVGGKGILAKSYSTVANDGDIKVSDGGVGISVSGASLTEKTTVVNEGSIIVNADNDSVSVGIEVNGALAENGVKGVITIDTEDGAGSVDDDVVENMEINGRSIGVKVNGGTFANNGVVQAKADKSVGVYLNGAIEEEAGSLGGDIFVDGKGAVGVWNENSKIAETQANITVNAEDAIGYYIDSVYTTKHSGGTDVKQGIGIDIAGGRVVNDGSVSVGSGAVGIRVGNYGNYVEFVNNGDINVKGGRGIEVNNGEATNAKSIEVNSGYGMYINSGRGINAGNINVSSGVGMYVAKGAIGENTGTITYKSGANANYGEGSFSNTGEIEKEEEKKEQQGGATLTSIVDVIKVAEGGTFVNKGVVELEDVNVNFDDGKNNDASFEIGNGGSYIANSFRGNVDVNSDVVKGGFEDVYVNKDSFVGKNEGVSVISKSYMFDAKTNVKDDVTDVELNRKSFEELVLEKDLANFLEVNYNLGNNEKMFDSLKSASNKNEFDVGVESETGKKFYANLPRENVAVLRGLTGIEQNRILQDGVKEKSVGTNMFVTGKDGTSYLSSYEDNVYSAYIGFGGKLNSNWSMGATLTAGYVDSSYDDINSERENKILMAFMPILYKNNNFKYLATPHIGFGLGNYTRYANSGKYEADTFDIYYGLANHMEYSVDVKVAELVYEAELNLLGVKSDDAEEKGGLILKSNDVMSLEAGIGLKLRKNIKLDKKRSIMFAVGSKYYQELLDPYEDLDITMKGSPVMFNNKGYDEDNKRIKTTLEALYKDGELNVGAEISHNKEKESSVEGAIGVRYNF